MGSGLGSIIDTVKSVTGALPGANLITDATNLALDSVIPGTPDVPGAPGSSAIKTGQIAGEGSGKAFSEDEADSRRKAVRKKRLGTKALQIPLANSASTGALTSTAVGLKV